MRCDEAQVVLSAWVDGEAELDLPARDHLAGCARCQGWTDAAAALRTRVRTEALVQPELRPDLAAAVLARLDPEPPSRRLARRALAVVAAVQLALALTAFLGERGHGHATHELGAWDAALAVGLLFAAFRPARAWGMLPLVAALVACLGVTSAIDVAAGDVGVTRELSHLLAVVSLWLLSRIGGVPSVRPHLRLAQ